MNVTINIDQLKATIKQIKSPPISKEIAELALEQLPKNLLDDLIQTIYYERVKQTPYFIAQHVTLLLNKYYFDSLKDLIEFLNRNSLHQQKINDKIVQTALEKNIPLEGYNITYVNR
jgi:uncharacterized membrane protein